MSSQTSRHKKLAKSSRTSRRETEALHIEQARAVKLADRYDVVVLGGGPAGLVAAICAQEAGAQTLVLEKTSQLGTSILATGGGRCNLSNTQLTVNAYNNPDFVEQLMCAEAGSVGQAYSHIEAFFSDSGLALTEVEGRVYPLSMQAASVREVLLTRAHHAGVALAPLRELISLTQKTDTLSLDVAELFDASEANHTLIDTQALIIATGGRSQLPSGLAIPTIPTRPALCALEARGLPFAYMDGRRVHARLSLMRQGKFIASDEGELLLRDFGLSGIVSFDISRFAQPGDSIDIDLAPSLDDGAWNTYLKRAKGAQGLIDPQLAHVLAEHSNLNEQQMKHLQVLVVGCADEGHAQITQGGLAVDAFDPQTLTWTENPHIYACGEILDIDAKCGGYNLSWAWLSGMRCGKSAAAFSLAHR